MTKRSLTLTDAGTARAVARRAGVVAKSRFSQNFLIDGNAVARIAEALEADSESTVVEIGPGLGTLTVELAKHARRVLAVEIDPACVRACQITLRDLANVEVIEADVRDVDLDAVTGMAGWLAAGNLPYHLTGALLQFLLERETPPQRAVFMVQREVARRLAAQSGDWSLATVAIRSLADVEIVMDVAPESFDPAPRVHSSVMRVVPHQAAPMSGEERRAVLALAKRAFQMRRKNLRHGVGNWLGGDLSLAEAILKTAGIDATRRPGTLNLDEWRALARTAISIRSGNGN